MAELYDTIGLGYPGLRRPDPRIARAILGALGDASTIVNVGAGAGSYEPRDRRVVAVESSMTMIRRSPRREMKGILVAVIAMCLLGVTTAARAEDLPPAGKLPDVGARVRVLAPSLGAGWHTGMFNRLRVEPPCYRVLIFSSGETRRVEAMLSVRELTRLQVSASTDSRSRSELPDRREQADPGEAWREVPLDLLRAAEQRCRLNRE